MIPSSSLIFFLARFWKSPDIFERSNLTSAFRAVLFFNLDVNLSVCSSKTFLDSLCYSLIPRCCLPWVEEEHWPSQHLPLFSNDSRHPLVCLDFQALHHFLFLIANGAFLWGLFWHLLGLCSYNRCPLVLLSASNHLTKLLLLSSTFCNLSKNSTHRQTWNSPYCIICNSTSPLLWSSHLRSNHCAQHSLQTSWRNRIAEPPLRLASSISCMHLRFLSNLLRILSWPCQQHACIGVHCSGLCQLQHLQRCGWKLWRELSSLGQSTAFLFPSGR